MKNQNKNKRKSEHDSGSEKVRGEKKRRSDEKNKYKLKKLIKELENIRGRHTELVSVYIPAGYNITDVIGQLKDEQGTAVNIKSKTTRKNVLSALEKIIQHLRIFRKAPPNGLVVFAGNISEIEGKEDIQLWSFEPPEPLKTKIYWCDQTFVLEPLKEMMQERDIYGLIVLDARDANIGLLTGKTIRSLKHLSSTVPSKTVKGGMCLSPDTLVTIKDGTSIPINKLAKSQKILSYDFEKSRFISDICEEIVTRDVKEALKISTKDNEIVASLEHLFFVKEGNKRKEKFAEDLKIGDLVFVMLNGMCVTQKIKNKSLLKVNEIFYDINVSNNENFLANGIIVHNSQHRYDKIREEAINEFLTKIGDTASELLLKRELKGIIIGGPGPIKERFAKGKYLNYMLLKKLLGVKDTSYTGEFGLQELVERSEDLLKESAITHEKAVLEKFFTALEKDGLVTYGVEEVKQALEAGAVDTLLISEEFDWVRVNYECQCGFRIKLDVPRSKLKSGVRCKKCKGWMKPNKDEMLELTDVLIEQAERTGVRVEMISTETREGYQFKELGGLGAMLRFKLN